jgi:hypothetical protein
MSGILTIPWLMRYPGEQRPTYRDRRGGGNGTREAGPWASLNERKAGISKTFVFSDREMRSIKSR